jgi:hypothetical protein
MKEKVIKREKGCYLKLPEEFRNVEEIEVFPLKEGYYLLSVPLGAASAAKEKPQESIEENVLKKLDSLALRKRSPSYLKKALSKEEGRVLEKLVKQGKVAYIHNKKFEEGIYVIENRKRPAKKEGEPNEMANRLFANGYIILEASRDAQSLSERLLKQKGSIMGVRGFDGKYYVVTSTYFKKAWEAVSKMGEEVTPEEVAEKFSLSIDGCKAVLKLLAEKGDYVEKKGGIYLRV